MQGPTQGTLKKRMLGGQGLLGGMLWLVAKASGPGQAAPTANKQAGQRARTEFGGGKTDRGRCVLKKTWGQGRSLWEERDTRMGKNLLPGARFNWDV